MISENLTVMGIKDSHDTLRQILVNRSPCKVLDAACGQGALARFLIDRGWDVHCADIQPAQFKLKSVPCIKINLNRGLPFEDASFDAVICANAIHRLFNPAGAIYEFYRILRPGGRLYLNVNNFASIDIRLRFLLRGSIEVRDPQLEQGINRAIDPEGNVRSRILFPQIAQYLCAAGFSIVSLEPSSVRRKHRLLLPVSWLVWMFDSITGRGKRERDFTRYTNGHAILRGGYYFVLEASKD